MKIKANRFKNSKAYQMYRPSQLIPSKISVSIPHKKSYKIKILFMKLTN